MRHARRNMVGRLLDHLGNSNRLFEIYYLMPDDTRSYITFALISCNVESSSGGFA